MQIFKLQFHSVESEIQKRFGIASFLTILYVLHETPYIFFTFTENTVLIPKLIMFDWAVVEILNLNVS